MLFKVLPKDRNVRGGTETVYNTREKDGKTQFLMYKANMFWSWEDAENYRPAD